MSQVCIVLCQFCDVHGPAVTFCTRIAPYSSTLSAAFDQSAKAHTILEPIAEITNPQSHQSTPLKKQQIAPSSNITAPTPSPSNLSTPHPNIGHDQSLMQTSQSDAESINAVVVIANLTKAEGVENLENGQSDHAENGVALPKRPSRSSLTDLLHQSISADQSTQSIQSTVLNSQAKDSSTHSSGTQPSLFIGSQSKIVNRNTAAISTTTPTPLTSSSGHNKLHPGTNKSQYTPCCHGPAGSHNTTLITRTASFTQFTDTQSNQFQHGHPHSPENENTSPHQKPTQQLSSDLAAIQTHHDPHYTPRRITHHSDSSLRHIQQQQQDTHRSVNLYTDSMDLPLDAQSMIASVSAHDPSSTRTVTPFNRNSHRSSSNSLPHSDRATIHSIAPPIAIPGRNPSSTTQSSTAQSNSVQNPFHNAAASMSYQTTQPSFNMGASVSSPLASSVTSRPNSPLAGNLFLNLDYLQNNERNSRHLSLQNHLERCYVSTRQPPMDLIPRCRNACIKSLSIEAASERVEPVVFCEGAVACFSYAFRLKDQQARGFQRWYSLVCISEDFSSVMWSWTYLAESFKQIATELQQSAEAVFMKEGKMQPPSAGRITGRSPMLPPPNAPRRPTPTQRILEEVVGIQNLIGAFHSWTSSVLHNFEERFIYQPLFRFSQHSYRYFEKCQHGVFPPPFSSGNDFMRDVVSLNHLQQLIGTDAMRRIIYNLIIGNQIIVRGDHSFLVHRALHILQNLIPEPCQRVIEDAKAYRHSYEANLLALTPSSAEIPSYLDAKTHVVLDIRYRQDLSDARQTVESDSSEALPLKFAFLKFRTFSKSFKHTTLGAKLERVFSTPHQPSFEAIYIEQLKAEWASKAKLFAVYARMPGSERPERISMFLRTLRLMEEDLLVLRFWATGVRASKVSHPFLEHSSR
eukprot:TRINITY_DN4824_c0_g1_i3.p1 TRINITY_DN4824_c0_g1~~TRINITY_DN4824_c0_g1_i3.p1  ORF type:complete len:914 (+),score=211.12 TRINITY_DN4824_c0_g1_i3:83-2824(+)